MPLDPRIEKVRVEYGLAQSDFWELPQKKGTWIAKHSALEMAAAKAGIRFDAPIVLEARGEAKCAALCVTGALKDRIEWSVGEASPANNKNAYPFAMAEKRGKDRVILKLIGLHGLIYSEDEADDFKEPTPPPVPVPTPTPKAENKIQPPHDQDVEDGVRNWTALRRAEIDEAARIPELYQWKDMHEHGLARLKAKHPSASQGLMLYYQAKFELLSKKETVNA